MSKPFSKIQYRTFEAIFIIVYSLYFFGVPYLLQGSI